MGAAIVAVHIHFAVFFQNLRDFFIRQRAQRIGAALARAGAFELHRLRIVNGHFFFVVETPQHIVGGQRKQLIRFDGFGQRRQMIEIIRLGVLRRQHLQQHAACGRLALRFASTDKQAGRQLFGAHEVIFQTRGQRIAFQTDDTLIALAFFRRNGNDQIAVADQRFQVGVRRNIALHARDAAHLLAVVAVNHGERHRAVAARRAGF